ncbi:hypothetical protein C4D60_Mb07t17870 [Musa balbisiana]|uniref:Uncharacterized protein n=1 Tax=Musa balbisiana TaxID=52838 RepID=A0A4S8JG35_MUSBA|nr:hypothetical protein C4D60_Mb07t17870 [Musa balbisiana]
MERTGSDIDRDTQHDRPKVFASLEKHGGSNFEKGNAPLLLLRRRRRTHLLRQLDALRMQIKVTQAAPAMNSSHRQLATVAESLARRVGRRLRRQPVLQAQFWSKSLATSLLLFTRGKEKR